MAEAPPPVKKRGTEDDYMARLRHLGFFEGIPVQIVKLMIVIGVSKTVLTIWDVHNFISSSITYSKAFAFNSESDPGIWKELCLILYNNYYNDFDDTEIIWIQEQQLDLELKIQNIKSNPSIAPRVQKELIKPHEDELHKVQEQLKSAMEDFNAVADMGILDIVEAIKMIRQNDIVNYRWIAFGIAADRQVVATGFFEFAFYGEKYPQKILSTTFSGKKVPPIRLEYIYSTRIHAKPEINVILTDCELSIKPETMSDLKNNRLSLADIVIWLMADENITFGTGTVTKKDFWESRKSDVGSAVIYVSGKFTVSSESRDPLIRFYLLLASGWHVYMSPSTWTATDTVPGAPYKFPTPEELALQAQKKKTHGFFRCNVCDTDKNLLYTDDGKAYCSTLCQYKE